MDKKEFIKKIIAGFPESFSKKDIEVEKEKYNLAIEENLDYNKLYELFLKNWRYKSAPSPAYFQDFFKECRNPLKLISMPSERRAALIKLVDWVEHSPEYAKCLQQKPIGKAPWYLRKLYKDFNFSQSELDFARVSGEIEFEAV